MKLPSLYRIAWIFLAGFHLGAAPLHAFGHNRLSKSDPDKVLSIDRVVRVAFPKMNNQAIGMRAKTPHNQFAEARDISFIPRFHGTRELVTKDGIDFAVFRVRLYSPGAKSLNIGFSKYHMPKGGSLHVYSATGNQEIRAFTDEDNDEHGQLWTPILETDEVVVEADVPLDSLDFLRLEIAKVNHGFKRLDAPDADSPLDKSVGGENHVSGSCNVDVACSEGNTWRRQINSVAVYSIDGTLNCTGSAINNVSNNNRPFFLTANHCQVDASNAPSVVAYWNFQNSLCRTAGSAPSGAAGDGTLTEFNTGTYFRAANATSDFTLLEFDDPINPQSKVFLAGWDRTTTNPASAVSIHHPGIAEKRISIDKNALSPSTYGVDISPGDGTHWRVGKWDEGVTESGSSGAPLFNPQGLIIGQLHGGFSKCGMSDLRDWYGRFSVSWTGNGTAATRLSNWLDPTGTGVTSIPGKEVNSSIVPVLTLLLN